MPSSIRTSAVASYVPKASVPTQKQCPVAPDADAVQASGNDAALELEKRERLKAGVLSFAESSISQSARHNNGSKHSSVCSNGESIKELIDSTNTRGCGRLVQPPDAVEFINTLESSQSDEPAENRHSDGRSSRKRKVPQATVDLKPDASPAKNETNLSSAPNQSNTDESSLPYLYVDVNITDTEMSTIEVFEGDKAEVLAKEFSIKHNLDERTERKLIEMLKAQMATVLCKIDEEENETNEDEDTE